MCWLAWVSWTRRGLSPPSIPLWRRGGKRARPSPVGAAQRVMPDGVHRRHGAHGDLDLMPDDRDKARRAMEDFTNGQADDPSQTAPEGSELKTVP